MPISDTRKDYFLAEAFECIGLKQFGDEWTETEWKAEPCRSLDEISQEHHQRLEALEETERELAAINKGIEKTIDGTQISGLREERAQIERRVEQKRDELFNHPAPNDVHKLWHDAFQRKQAAENALIDALKTGVLKAHDGDGFVIPTVYWQGQPYFRYYIRLSIVRISASASPKSRILPARIDQSEFDAWLKSVKPWTVSARKTLTIDEKLREFFSEKIKEHGEIIPYSRGRLFTLAQEECGDDLTGRQFDHAWRNYAPARWTRAGAKPKKRSNP